MGALRATHGKWNPASQAKKAARVRRGVYLCALCGKEGPATTWTTYKSGDKKGQPKKVKNAVVDHTNPVIDPAVGFVDWNTVIERMFLEVEGYQVICHACHETKTAEERVVRTERLKGEV
jgi:hypothetical protein